MEFSNKHNNRKIDKYIYRRLLRINIYKRKFIYSRIFSGIGDPLYLVSAELKIPHGGDKLTSIFLLLVSIDVYKRIFIYSKIFSGIGDPLYLVGAELKIPHGGEKLTSIFIAPCEHKCIQKKIYILQNIFGDRRSPVFSWCGIANSARRRNSLL